MRILILAGVAAAALTLTACNREEPAATTPDEGSMAAETGAMAGDSSTGGTMSSGPTSGGSSAGSASNSGSGSMSSGSGTGATSGGSMPAIPPAEAPATEATRQGAKEKAESTNLHPSG